MKTRPALLSRRRPPCRRRDDGERGSVSAWLALASFVMIVLVGLVVDLGGQLETQQRARDVATQAARAGGQRLQAAAVIQGRDPSLEVGVAKAAARDYLAAAGIRGTVSVSGGTTITVSVHDTYRTVFLSVIGIGSIDATGTASARIARTLGGSEQ